MCCQSSVHMFISCYKPLPRYFLYTIIYAGLDIKVLALPAPGQVILNYYLPNYKIYLPNIRKQSLELKIDYQ